MERIRSDMSSELKRYATFNGFHTPAGVWPLQLAQAGFYRSGTCQDNELVCFTCGLVVDVGIFRKGSVMETHRRMSPACSFVCGTSDNQPVPSPSQGAASLEWLNQNFSFNDDLEEDCCMPVVESQSLPPVSSSSGDTVDGHMSMPNLPFLYSDFTSEMTNLPIFNNLNTLEQIPGLDSLPADLIDGLANANLASVPISSLFHNGSFNDLPSSVLGGPEEIVVADCDSAGIVGNYPSPSMTQSEQQQLSSQVSVPPSDGLAGEIVQSEMMPREKITFDDLGIVTERPKRQDLATVTMRLQTFQNWRGQEITQTQDSIADAGFYYAGYSDCCRCFYCGGGLKNWESDDDPWVEHARWFKDCPYIKTSKGKDFIEAVQSLARTNNTIKLSDVEEEMKRISDQTSLGSNLDSQVSCDNDMEVQPSEDKSEVDRLQSENDVLRQPETCKICLDGEVSVLYVPCGHLISCAACAPTVQTCPVCRHAIHGQVRIQRTD